MSRPRWLTRKAEALMGRLGLSYEQLLGARFAVNVLISTLIVWTTLGRFGIANPIWALASMIAASDPRPEEARRLYRGRIANMIVGCATGLAVVLWFPLNTWTLSLGLAATVLIATYVVRIKAMWRQAPITAALVIGSTIASGSMEAGLQNGMQKVAEVIFGCLVGVVVSIAMSKLWLVRPPKKESRGS